MEVITSDEEILREVRHARGRGTRSSDFVRAKSNRRLDGRLPLASLQSLVECRLGLFLRDPRSSAFRKYALAGMPTSLMLDKEGTIRAIWPGELTEAQIEEGLMPPMVLVTIVRFFTPLRAATSRRSVGSPIPVTTKPCLLGSTNRRTPLIVQPE